MLLYNARDERGFSMFEIVIALLVVGVLIAIAIPSFAGMMSQNKVKDALNRVQGALKEAQREAISKGRNCTVTVPKSTNASPDVTLTSDCFMTGNRTLSDVRINHNKATTNWVINFDFKGRTSANGTIAIYAPNITSNKCVVMSQGIGLFRSGDYSGDPTTTVTAGNCTTYRPKL